MSSVSKMKEKKINILAGILITLCASFMLFIYAPYELYMTNQEDFWFNAKLLFKPAMVSFLLVFFAGTAAFFIAHLINRKLYYALLAGALSATIATYIQGTFLVNGLPPMDGTEYDWSQPSPERIKTIVVWAVAIAAVVFICLKFKSQALKSVTTFVSVALLFMLSVSLISIFVTTADSNLSKDEYLTCANNNLHQLSNDENLVVLVLDAVDSDTFADAVQNNPEFENTFDDFTFYRNVLSGYIFTRESFPFIFSGDWYENDEDFITYQNNAFDRSPLINALEDRDYKIGIYGDFNASLKKSIFEGRFENFIQINPSFKNLPLSIKVICRMAGIRYAPWDLKSFMYKLDWTIQVSRSDEYMQHVYNCGNGPFYNTVKNEDIFDTVDERCCRIIHISGAHVPFYYNKEMQVVDDATYTSSVEACVTICDTYIQKLKESNLYDNTAIVIMADHGYAHNSKAGLAARSNPILLVKGIDEHHELTTSYAPISQEDFAKSFIGLLDGEKGSEIFDYKEGDARERRVMIYEYLKEHHMSEYVTTGSANDPTTLQPTGKEYILDD